jgi:hypothetical protein
MREKRRQNRGQFRERNAKPQSPKGAERKAEIGKAESRNALPLCGFAAWRLCVEMSFFSVKTVKSAVPFPWLRRAAPGHLAITPSLQHSVGLFLRLFCGKSAQVPVYEQLTIKSKLCQSRSIKANQG